MSITYAELRQQVKQFLDEGHSRSEAEDFILHSSVLCDNCPNELPAPSLVVVKYKDENDDSLCVSVLCPKCFTSLQINALLNYGEYIPSIKPSEKWTNMKY